MRCVITGGPCSGKTSLISLFKSKGLPVLSETARDILRNRGNKPYHRIEVEIFRKQLEKEESKKSGRIFQDRSALDTLAYCILYLERIPEEIGAFDFRNRYDRVFIPDRLPFKSDKERIESSDEEAQRIHEKIFEVYRSFGYSPIPIPVMPLKKRGELILQIA